MANHDKLIQPLLAWIPRSVKPNHLALLRIVLIVPIAVCILNGLWLAAMTLFILASALDVADGTLARTRNQASVAGEMLDPVADKLLFGVTFILLGFTLLPANLYITVIMVEAVTLMGAIVTASIWYRLYKENPRVSANHFGKIKTACYFVATLLLFASPWSFTTLIASILIYYIGLLAAILSMVAYDITLSKKP